MNSLEIDRILRKNPITSRQYAGCFPSDKIPPFFADWKGQQLGMMMPTMLFRPQCMVVNTDSSQGTGEHWLALYFPTKKHVEYYDSFGEWPPPYKNIEKFVSQFDIIRYNVICLQSQRSSSCGRHAIYFLHMRCKGYSFDQIIAKLRRTKTNPDALVSGFFHSLQQKV